MSDSKKQVNIKKVHVNTKNVSVKKKSNKSVFIIIGLAVIILVGFFIVKAMSGGSNAPVTSSGEEIRINKSDISEIARFYPYKAGSTDMEVIAVKASDGTIRTALNTCQVCYDSGKGYYIQEGNELVCQNCGNRFMIDQIEKQKNGCNPVPVDGENKIDDGTTITISKDFLDQNKDLFGNWKKG